MQLQQHGSGDYAAAAVLANNNDSSEGEDGSDDKTHLRQIRKASAAKRNTILGNTNNRKHSSTAAAAVLEATGVATFNNTGDGEAGFVRGRVASEAEQDPEADTQNTDAAVGKEKRRSVGMV